ncbi:MAG TPA: NAD(P)H-quinone oxidoreductase [Candidatus Acidoferrales bacterium]|nr:NAD(P)H-quinone oxidoreductase [Candidatus Acidoferrales bacterium]
MRAVIVSEPGGPENLRVEERPDPPRAGDAEIVIRVAAAGVNRADLLQRMGRYPPPPGASDILGLEASGVVESAGGEVAGLAAGDRVMALLEGGGYAELVAVRARQAVRVPDTIDLIDAGGIPEVFITAHDALFTRGRLQHGETVLIHGGGGGVGTAAVQLARHHGCRVLVTAGSEGKIARCVELGADAGINYRTDDFVARTRELTDGRGADVVIDIMGASYLGRNLEAVATDGRIIVLGMLGGTHSDIDIGAMMRRRVSLISTVLRARPADQKAAIVAAFAADVVPGIADRTLHPVIDRVLTFDQASDAHRQMEAGEAFGKILLVPAARA